VQSAFEQFYEFIEPRMPPGVPGSSVDRAIREAAIRTYRDTGFWTEYTPSPVSLEVGVKLYEVQSPEPEATICDIERMSSNGVPVYKRERSWLDRWSNTWETDKNAQPTSYFIVDFNDARCQFQVYPIPDTASTNVNNTALVLRCALCPTNVARHLDGTAYALMRDTIAAGALVDILGQFGQPWYNAQERQVRETEFLKGLLNLRVRRELGEGKSVATVQTGYFGFWQSYA
jgi:hypothetical protein